MTATVIWAPQEGSQMAFLSCPLWEVLYGGTRGPGKTDALIMDFASDTGIGLGRAWRGVLFRRTYPELEDVIAKSKKWFYQLRNPPTFNEAKSTWTWPTGEQLLLRHMLRPADYWSYHGHEYPWIGWEELTTWPTSQCYTLMMSCSRSSHPEAAKRTRIRATTNPYGIGHNWVKERWRLPMMIGKPILDSLGADGMREPARLYIHGTVHENRKLLDADPNYISKLKAAARNEAELKAWLYGDWNIIAGGMFDDVIDAGTHMVPNFPARLIPRGWRIDRSFDWGSSKPFSVGWWCESNGEPIEWCGRTIGAVRGDLIRFNEWYGWTGKRNEGVRMLPRAIAEGILDREDDMGLLGRVHAGPADSAIWDEQQGVSIAHTMERAGVSFAKADKGPGSRKQGWQMMRDRFGAALVHPQEEPGLFATERCAQFWATVPFLPRADRDMDDIDTDAEDHIADETRYRVRMKDLSVRRRVQ